MPVAGAAGLNELLPQACRVMGLPWGAGGALSRRQTSENAATSALSRRLSTGSANVDTGDGANGGTLAGGPFEIDVPAGGCVGGGVETNEGGAADASGSGTRASGGATGAESLSTSCVPKLTKVADGRRVSSGFAVEVAMAEPGAVHGAPIGALHGAPLGSPGIMTVAPPVALVATLRHLDDAEAVVVDDGREFPAAASFGGVPCVGLESPAATPCGKPTTLADMPNSTSAPASVLAVLGSSVSSSSPRRQLREARSSACSSETRTRSDSHSLQLSESRAEMASPTGGGGAEGGGGTPAAGGMSITVAPRRRLASSWALAAAADASASTRRSLSTKHSTSSIVYRSNSSA